MPPECGELSSAPIAINALTAAKMTPRPTARRHRRAIISRTGCRVSRAHVRNRPRTAAKYAA
jgi:hypothetical protein